MAQLPVSYTSSLSFCHSSHVVVYFILLSVVSKFCSGLRGIFSSHTGQHEKLAPVSPVQSTVEPLYNGHPWDWAKVTLIAG